MSPIIGVIDSAKTGNLVTGAYESISTQLLGSAQSSVTFSSIPQTYKHLQLRFTAQATGTPGGSFQMYMNGDTSGNYAAHWLYANGTNFLSGGTNTATAVAFGLGLQQTGYPGVGVMDILDYTSTNKYKTTRTFSAVDPNGSGGIVLYNTSFLNTANGLSALNSITIFAQSANIAANSIFALYGIKG